MHTEQKNKPRILIIDDKMENIQILSIMLKLEGYEIHTAQDGMNILQLVENIFPSLILLDVMMPDMDGYDICTQLKASPNHADIPVIFLTAKTSTSDIIKGFEAGAVDYITKPFEKKELLARVKTHLKLRQTEASLRHSLEKSRQQADEITALLIGAKAVLNYRHFEDAAKIIFYTCTELIGASAGYVALLSEDKTENNVIFLEDGNADCTVDPNLPMPIRGLRAEAYASVKTVYDNDFSNSQWVKYMPEGHVHLENVMFAPLVIEGKAAGVIGIANKPGGFTDEDVRLASAFGEYAAIALVNARNLDALEKSQHECEISKDKAEKANQAKVRFLTRMSHELRTPMNAIIGMTDLTLQTPLMGDQKENLKAVKNSAYHLLGLINDILDFSVIESGKMKLESVDFVLEDVLCPLIRMFKVQADKKQLYLKLECEKDVPPYLKGDPIRLRQALVNLISNAVKFTNSGGVTVRVSRSQAFSRSQAPAWEREENADTCSIRFAVSDTGIGIPKDKLQIIFENFTQIGNINEKLGSTGLGLPICRQLANLMGGKIWVESEEGKGSTFYFETLFLLGNKMPAQNSSRIVQDSPLSTQLSILSAEDNPFNAKIITAIVEKLGYKIINVPNGEEALKTLSDKPFDLILMDLEMPIMGGEEAAQRIRSGEAGDKNRNIPIIAVTAHVLDECRDACYAAGMNDFITKPVDFSKLSAIIKKNTEGNNG